MRFRKLLFACQGMPYAVLDPPSQVDDITQKTFDKLRTAPREHAGTYLMATAELYRKKENLLSSKDAPPTDDVLAHKGYLCQKREKLEAIFAEESQAATLYVQFMLSHQITN